MQSNDCGVLDIGEVLGWGGVLRRVGACFVCLFFLGSPTHLHKLGFHIREK